MRADRPAMLRHRDVAHAVTMHAGGGGENIWHKTYNGKAVPAELQGPDYVTYGGVTIKKEFHAFDFYLSQVFGAAVT